MLILGVICLRRQPTILFFHSGIFRMVSCTSAMIIRLLLFGKQTRNTVQNCSQKMSIKFVHHSVINTLLTVDSHTQIHLLISLTALGRCLEVILHSSQFFFLIRSIFHITYIPNYIAHEFQSWCPIWNTFSFQRQLFIFFNKFFC